MDGPVLNADRESNRARRYLLGQASEDEQGAIEQEFFRDEQSLERMEAAEENLIEDYLEDRLDANERILFERSYLTTPYRRARVEMIRGLASGTQSTTPEARPRRLRVAEWATLAAAAVIVLVLGGSWMFRSSPRSDTAADRAGTPPISQPTTVAPAPRIFAISISPTTVRSAGGNTSVVIPAGTDIVRLHLEGEAGTTRIEAARARVRTVSGTQVWRGSAGLPDAAPPGAIAQIDVPAAQLPPDDYVIELFDVDTAGAERERARYFFPVRAR
jgi:hypothetical protein